MSAAQPPTGRIARLPSTIAWRGCAAVSTFLSDFSPRAAPVIASASFLAFAARIEAEVPRTRRATSPAHDETERAHIASLLRGGLSGG